MPRCAAATSQCLRDAPALRASGSALDVPVYPGFLSEEEEASLMALTTTKLGKDRYDAKHFDGVINGCVFVTGGGGVRGW